VKLTAFSKDRIEVIIPFEMPPVLLKYLGGILEHCIDLGGLTLDNCKKVDKTIMTEQ
jgi:hypothetical protein